MSPRKRTSRTPSKQWAKSVPTKEDLLPKVAPEPKAVDVPKELKTKRFGRTLPLAETRFPGHRDGDTVYGRGVRFRTRYKNSYT